MNLKFDILVEKVLTEASGHKSKALMNLLGEVESHPSIRAVVITKKIQIYPVNKDFPLYTAHFGEEAFHPVRRYFDKVKADWESTKSKEPAMATKTAGYWTPKKKFN